MKRHDFMWGLFFLFIGIGTCVMAYRYKLGTIREPGAGLIPFGVAALLGLMSIGLCLRSLLPIIKAREEGERVPKGIAWGRMGLVLCALLGYGLAFDVLGFHLCTFLLMIVLLGVVGRQTLRLTLAVSLFTVLCVYLVFEVWLGCPFPRGPFGI